MEVFERLPKESARAYALRVLKKNIVECILAPGSMVSETAIAKELGISRAPVKEAMGELEHLRLVEIRPQSGIVITKVCIPLLRDTVLARKAIDTAVFERYCLSDEVADLRELEMNLEMQRVVFRYRDFRKLWELDNEFHARALTLAGGERLCSYIEDIRLVNDRARFLAENHSQTEYTLLCHQRIFEALKAKDAVAVREAMDAHLQLSHVLGENAELPSRHPDFFSE